MIIKIEKRAELSDGRYISEITGIRPYPQKNACAFDFTPFKNNQKYRNATLWINGFDENDDIGYRFFETLGILDEGKVEIDTDFLETEFLNSYIGIVIKDNEKNGVVYHNIVDFFEVDMEDTEEDIDSDDEDDSEDDEDEDDELPTRNTSSSGFRSFKRSKRR